MGYGFPGNTSAPARTSLPELKVCVIIQGNMERIIESIVVAKARGAAVRVGPELEIPGYGCLDHFLEGECGAVAYAGDVLINDGGGDDDDGDR